MNADVGFESVKEEILPAFLETLVYGSMRAQEEGTHEVPQEGTHEAPRPLIDWTNFITFSDNAAKGGGRYYTFGISELSVDVNAYKEFSVTHTNVQKLKERIREDDEELTKTLNEKKREFSIETLTVPHLLADERTYEGIFRGNIVYQKKYFDYVYLEVEKKLAELRGEKKRIDKEIEELKEGKEEVKKFIEDKRKEEGLAEDKLWKEVLKRFKKGEEIGKNNLEKARKALEGRLIKSLIKRIDSHIKGLKPEIEKKEKEIKPLNDKIGTLEEIVGEVVRHRNILESSIKKAEEEIERGEEKLDEIKESIIKSMKKGLIATYPDFDMLTVSKKTSLIKRLR